MSKSPHLTAQNLFLTAQKSIKKNNLAEAESLLAQAIALDEGNSGYWYHLGVLWLNLDKRKDALDALQMSLQLDPDNDKTLEALGDLFLKSGHLQQSIVHFAKAYRHYKDLNTASAPVAAKLAKAFYRNNDLAQAVNLMGDLVIKFPHDKGYMSALAEMYRRYVHPAFDQKGKEAITICLQHDHLRFNFFAPSWASLLFQSSHLEPFFKFSSRYNPDITLSEISAQLEDQFLCHGLEKIPVRHVQLELALSNMRRYFLMHWEDHSTWPKEALDFLSALALQCWYNDYVFFQTKEEKEALPALKLYLTEQLGKNNILSDSHGSLIALCAAYIPLYELYKGAEQLPLSRTILHKLKSLIRVQLTHPQTEQDLISTIPDFTPIEDTTSKAVQNMYEQRPYPRWKSANVLNTSPINQNAGEGIKMLVAGCGTGQEPAIYANALPKAHITAIDLSRTSIAYGKRMAKELGFLPRINFLHGDLMKVSELNQSFDFVASSGVLHHLKEPEKGLSAILSTLKIGGRLSISLYSKAARDFTLGPASTYIEEKNYSSSVEDIRQFRRDIMLLPEADPRTRCLKTGDFYSLTECNDLLFHVQEHRYTPSMIWEMADRHHLVPFHIYMTPDRNRLFNSMFPGESPLNPLLLEKFEETHPKAFIEMYKIYFYRKGEEAKHPLDPLIQLGII